MSDEIVQQFQSWIRDLVANDLIPELIAFLLVLLFGFLLQAILKRLLNRIERLAQRPSVGNYAPWVGLLFELGRQGARPFALWIVGLAAIRIMQSLGQPTGLLNWLVPYFGIWLVYNLLSTLIRARMSPTQSHLWNDQILRPAVILLVLMQALGILDDTLGYQINFGRGIVVSVSALLFGLVVFYIFILASRYVRLLLKEVILPRMDVDPSLTPVVVTVSGYLIISVGALVGLSVAGVGMTNVAVILGGLSVGLGFGLKELVNNFISGFILLIERSLVPGDIIKIDGESGVVEDIKLRTTQIRTFDNVELIVPNGQLLGDIVTNYSQRGVRRKRIHVTVGAGYDDDPQLVVETLLAAAASQPDVLAEPEPRVLMTGFDDSSIGYELLAWVADSSLMASTSSALRMIIWRIFRDKGIDMPYPQRDLHIRSSTGSPIEIDQPHRREDT